jgi:large subunit ribosomal protein L32
VRAPPTEPGPRPAGRDDTDQEYETDMGVPKRKVAHARQMDRRSHHALTLPRLEACPHCHEPKLPHRVCPNCGWYRGRLAVEPKPAGGSAGSEEAAS